MAFEQVFKNIDNALRTDEGCSSELDYVEQSSWILFLKYLDDLDKENEMAALLGGGVYTPILDEEYRWNTWAMPVVMEVSITRLVRSSGRLWRW